MIFATGDIIALGALPSKPVSNVLSCAAECGSASFLSWLAKHGTQWWPMFTEIKIQECSWHHVEKGIRSLCETEMLDWVYHTRKAHPPPH